MWRRYLCFFGADVHSDVSDELEFHIEAKTSELIERGYSREDARREAIRQFGDLGEMKALCVRIGEKTSHKTRKVLAVNEWWYDLRYAARSLRRAPWFTLIAASTLAAGIAGTASLFSVVDAFVIRAVRFPEPRQLVFVDGLDARRGREIGVSFPDYEDLRARSNQLQLLAAWNPALFTLIHDGTPERVGGAQVSPNFFETLQVRPVLGRAFLARESEPGSSHVAVISYGFWQGYFKGDRSVIGAQVELDGKPYTITGVLPERFHFTFAGRANVWAPLTATPELRADRQNRFLQLIGRMKQDREVAQVRQELASIAHTLAVSYPDSNADVGIVCTSLHDEIGRHTGEEPLLVVFGVTLGLLLIACSNVANLLLVRAMGRKRQVSVQLSLGASRGRVIRQMLVESLLLFLIAATAGVAGAHVLTSMVTGTIPWENRGYLPNYGSASLNGTVLMFVLAITLATGILFGLAAALENTRVNIVAALKETAAGGSQTRRTIRIRGALACAQVALACVLLSCMALLVGSFRATWTAPMGFDSAGVLTFCLSPDQHKYTDATQRRIFFESAVGAIEMPMRQVAAAAFTPFGNASGGTSFRLHGEDDARRLPTAQFNSVSTGFFAVLRAPLLAGRMFSPADAYDAPLVALVNEAFAKKYFNGESALGQKVWITALKNRPATIIGVVAEIRQDADPAVGKPQLYVPFAQDPPDDAFFFVRQEGANATAQVLASLPEIRRKIAAIDPRQPVYDAKTLDERVREQLAPFWIFSGLLVWFGSLALILSAIGTYSVIAFSVAQRTREIGIRMALGAGRMRVAGMVLRDGLWIVVAGLIPGLLASFGAGRVLRSLITYVALQGVGSAILFTVAVLGGALLLALLLPSKRAATVDPVTALRCD